MIGTRDDEERLVRRAVEGDPLARRALVQRHGPLLWSLCRRLDPEPEDAYQECWEKVLKGLPRFRAEGAARLNTWMMTVAHNHLVDRFRRRRPTEPFDEALLPANESYGESVAGENEAALEAALLRLPPARRRVLVLHHLHGLSLEAIAASEGTPLGTIKSRLHRARAELLGLLTEGG